MSERPGPDGNLYKGLAIALLLSIVAGCLVAGIVIVLIGVFS